MEKYILFSPHPDDSILSMGGTILMKNQEVDFINCDIFTKKKYSIVKICPELANEVILNEEKAAMNEVGISNVLLEFEEALERKNGKLSDVLGKKITYEEIKQEAVYYELEQKIREQIEKINPSAVFVPMGCGWHRDHLIVRFCVEEIIKSKKDITLFLYEDMPYSCNEEWRKIALIEAEEKFELEEIQVNIDECIERKIEIVKLYETQLKQRDIRIMKNYWSSISESGFCERIWKVVQFR